MYVCLAITIYVLCLVIIFPDYPIIGDKFNKWFLHNKWNHSDWATFLGGIIGAFATIIAVYLQLKKNEENKIFQEKAEKKKKILNFLKLLDHNLKKSLLDNKLKEKLLRSYEVISYAHTARLIIKENIEYIYPLSQNGLTVNSIDIFETRFANLILEVNEEIIEFNKSYNYLIKNLDKKIELVEQLKNNNIQEYEILKNLSEEIRWHCTIPWMLDRNIVKEKAKKIQELTWKLFSDLSRNKIHNEIRERIIDFYLWDHRLLNPDIFQIFSKIEKLSRLVEEEIKKYE
ncbi:hypothetical protein MWF99_09340 [Fusobacterium necrophorum]|uniref:hypothetical protein n=1 Tax=Fusobacterium necrophorum TaxID=859 RepID=UPI00254D97B8|nr:hypothetical protein [Fusobacterium necrophorum]MDK4523065.1 hypothetical protein [Fusobacterium necrophorum]